MASIRIETAVTASPDKAWAAFRDVGAVHTRLARGFVTDCRMEEGARIVTFANGFVAKELIVDIDDENRRLAYSVSGSERLSHHNASFQVIADNGGSRIVWQADILPDAAEPVIRGMMEQGTAAMRKTLEAA
ncbi:MAG TPA: SRPBCC family protein [Rhizomicrobium sp.]|nr:SRPBCC family protein [Rhizomicrobium sp.]